MPVAEPIHAAPDAIPRDEEEPADWATFAQRLLIVILVWLPTIINCVYFMQLGTLFTAIMFYILGVQLFILGLHTSSMYAVSAPRDRYALVLGHIALFTVFVRQDKNCCDYLFMFKEVLLVISIALIQVFYEQSWSAFAVAVLSINALALLGDYCAVRTHLPSTIATWATYLEAHQEFRTKFLYILIGLSYLYTVLVLYICYHINLATLISVVAISCFFNFSIVIGRYCDGPHLTWAGAVRILLGVPFCVSNTMNSAYCCLKCLSVLMFFFKYVALSVMLYVIVLSDFIHQRIGLADDVSSTVKLTAFILSLFAPIEIILGSCLYPM